MLDKTSAKKIEITTRDVEDMFLEFDKDQDGRINYEELKQFVVAVSTKSGSSFVPSIVPASKPWLTSSERI